MLPIRRPAFTMVLFGALSATAALSSSNYPGEVSNHLGGTTPIPSCTACHTSNAGGGGTVTPAFGLAMLDQGLSGGGDVAALTAALDALEAAGTDSDTGGVGDVAELRAGTNPNDGADDGNTGGGGGGDQLQYGFGCGATTTPGGAGAALGLLLLGLRRRRVG
jgi:MYXO-CTERM domain-containing protein